MRTLFKHNGQIIYSIDYDIYIDELQLLVNHIAHTIEAEPEEIELERATIEYNNIDKSNIAVTSDGDLIFDIRNNEFGVNFMENKPIKGLRLSSDIMDEIQLQRFLDKIIDNKADENLEFTI